MKEFDLAGCPIYFDLVGKEKHEPGMSFSAIRAAQEKSRNQAHTPKWKTSEASDDDDAMETLED